MKTYGYIPSKLLPEHRVLGSSKTPFKVFRPDGNWSDFLPSKVIQNTKFETYDCTAFNTLAQIECFMKAVYGVNVSYSPRWVGIIAGTQPPGNDPQTVYDAIREYGLIPDSMLPWSDDIQNVDEYYSFKGANDQACYVEGRKWLSLWELHHDWVFGDGFTDEEKLNNVKVALTASPLALAVYAWQTDERGVYIRAGDDCHWTFMYSLSDFEKIEDSYDPNLKNVEQSFNFVKKIYIEKKTVDKKPSLCQLICGKIQSIWKTS